MPEKSAFPWAVVIATLAVIAAAIAGVAAMIESQRAAEFEAETIALRERLGMARSEIENLRRHSEPRESQPSNAASASPTRPEPITFETPAEVWQLRDRWNFANENGTPPEVFVSELPPQLFAGVKAAFDRQREAQWLENWSADELWLAGVVELFGSRNGNRAGDYLAVAIGKDAGNAAAQALAGWSAFTSGDFSAAKAASQTATSLAPDNWWIWRNHGYILAKSGDAAAARLTFARALELVPARFRVATESLRQTALGG